MKHALRLTIVMVMALLISVTMTSAQDEGERLAFNGLPAGTVLDHWAVVLQPGSDATTVANALGFNVLYPVGNLPNTYVFTFEDSGRNALAAREAANHLRTAPEVVWFQQQYVLPLELKQAQRDPNGGGNSEGPAPQNAAPAPVAEAPADPLVTSQWHITNTGQFGGVAGNDARIEVAWDAGYTGQGVVVSAVEGGVESSHVDIADNFNNAGSNASGTSGTASHGTSVAGVMAAVANGAGTGTANCGVGVAYDAEVSSIGFSSLSDADLSANINHENQINDVYNNSYGPFDSGAAADLLNLNTLPMTEAMFQDAVTNGRGGLGSIIVWAAGNGRGFNDNVNADGLASAIQTIAVGAFGNNGVVSSYSEPGASMLVTGPSSGNGVGIVTTDVSGSGGYGNGQGWSADCTDSFGGTSSSSPLVSGVVALMLDANPNLTWRDVQYILIDTAWQVDPGNADWTTNDAGRLINHNYGFGAVDAGAATAAAANWINAGVQTTTTMPVSTVSAGIPDDNATGASDTVNVTDDFNVEHVEINLNVTHANRSHLEVELTSPAGTVSRMIYNRTNDTGANFNNFRMMTVRNWGENSVGNWTLTVKDLATGTTGTFDDWQLIVHGTDTLPSSGGGNTGDTCADPITVNSLPYSYNGDLTTGFTNTITDYPGLTYLHEYGGNDQIFTFNVPASAGGANLFDITLTSGDPGNTDYQIILLSACGDGSTVVGNGNDFIDDSTPDFINIEDLAAGTYYLYVDAWSADPGYPKYGPFTLEISEIFEKPGDPARLEPFGTEVIGTGDQWPAFTFADSGEEWYQVWIGPADYSSQALFAWYPATDSSTGASAGSGICEAGVCTIPIDVWGAAANGDYEWWISYWSSGDTGADIDASWDMTTFSVDYAAPAEAAVSSPTDTVTSSPSFIGWPNDPDTLWYQVWIGPADYSTQIAFNWYDAREICSIGCAIDVSETTFADGDYAVWIESWGPNGYVTWTDNMSNPSTFTVDTSGGATSVGNDGPVVAPDSPSRAGSSDAPAVGNDGPTTVSPSRGG